MNLFSDYHLDLVNKEDIEILNPAGSRQTPWAVLTCVEISLTGLGEAQTP